MLILEITGWLAVVYCMAGLLFALAFITKGVDNIDEGAKGASMGFRIIIIPGVMVFWPLLWKKWRFAMAAKDAPISPENAPGIFKAQRNLHLRTWSLLLLILPLGILTAWLVIPPAPVTIRLLAPTTIAPLPIVVRSAERKGYRIHLRTGNDRQTWQLEWETLSVLTTPSALIYRVNPPDASKNQLIGRIESKGDYLFPLEPDSAGYGTIKLVLYDFIHHTNIDSINF